MRILIATDLWLPQVNVVCPEPARLLPPVPGSWCGDRVFDAGGLPDLSIADRPEHPLRRIGMHEAIEAYLAIHAGVSSKAVDKFDRAYEAKRKAGDDSDPGEDPKPAYHKEHMVTKRSSGCSPSSLASIGRPTIERCRASDRRELG